MCRPARRAAGGHHHGIRSARPSPASLVLSASRPYCLTAFLALAAWRPWLCAQVPENPSAGRAPLAYGAGVALGSGHADRGFLISDRPVLQPETWLGWGGTELSLWSSFTLAQTTDGSRPQIVELELTRRQTWGRLVLGPAVRAFLYHDPLSPASTRSVEAWLNLTYDMGPVSLYTNQSVDVLAYPGAYFGEAGIASEHHVSPDVAVGGSLGAGWASAAFNDAYAGIATAALDRLSVQAWLTARLRPHLTIGPRVELSTIVDPAVRAQLAHPTYLLLGLTTGLEH